MKQLSTVKTREKGKRKKAGTEKYPNKYKRGIVANDPHVPGAGFKKPIPKKEQKRTEGSKRCGAFLTLLIHVYNPTSLNKVANE
ncbi:MAG: hypothetical protein OHK0056_04530 [Bacteriovoracaceae bacterium]